MVRFLLLSLWILAIGGGSAQKISGQTVYKAHVSDAEGNAVEYATAVLLSGEKQVGGAVANRCLPTKHHHNHCHRTN